MKLQTFKALSKLHAGTVHSKAKIYRELESKFLAVKGGGWKITATGHRVYLKEVDKRSKK